MANNGLNKQIMWLITIISKQNLSDRDRDFLAELVSEEARKTSMPYRYILHDIVESNIYYELLIEGSEAALDNMLSVIRDNLPYRIIYRNQTP